MKTPLILLTNNKYEDPFLHSQLINLYKDSDFSQIYLYSGKPETSQFISPFLLKDNYIQSKKGIVRYIYYYLSVLRLILSLKNQKPVIHLRGFVSALMFYFIPTFYMKHVNYIYDPRGAFIHGKQEAYPKFKKPLEMLRIIEKSLIKHSLFTVVESKRLKDQMIGLYGLESKYEICYNVSSFSTKNEAKINLKDKIKIRICYCGSVNHWHDIDEIRRLYDYLNKVFKDKIIENYVFTQKRNHQIVKKCFENFDNHLVIDFVPYYQLESKLNEMDICLSIVLPNKSTEITSPIKISDYILLNKIMVLNKGIGDFDSFFIKNKSAILFDFRKPFNFSKQDLYNLDISKNKRLKDILSIHTNKDIVFSKIKKISY